MHDGLAQNHALKFEFLSKKQNGEHEPILSGWSSSPFKRSALRSTNKWNKRIQLLSYARMQRRDKFGGRWGNLLHMQ